MHDHHHTHEHSHSHDQQHGEDRHAHEHHSHGQNSHDHRDREPFDWRGLFERYRKPLIGLAVLVLAWSALFTVRETEFALVTQFGKPIRTVTDAGLSFKVPLLHQVQLFDRRLRVYNPPRSEFLTKDKKNLSIDSYALWQIADPQAFVQAVGNERAAEMRLHDLVWSGLAATIAGLVIHEARIIPEIGQIFVFHGFRFEVVRRERNQLTRIRVSRAEAVAQEVPARSAVQE